ncbi:MAG: L-2-hydroxyglutarate oxidase [Chitinophagales bacterium]|nr:L-2-hydroxyglutarate oxidase [Chitinophagales bacterium]
MAQKKIVVIGAGLVGLATAYRMQEAMPDAKVIVIEKEDGSVRHQSSHNSGVIHSGVYYQPGSLKAQNCIAGYHYLTEFCQQHGVDFRITGKLIVAVNEEEERQLPVLQQRAAENDLQGVRMLNAREIAEKEPAIQARSGLWIPQTGIVDFVQLADKLCELLRVKGAELYFHQEVEDIVVTKTSLYIQTRYQSFEADMVVNCAGLYSDKIALMAGVHLGHRIIPFRGEYFILRKKAAQKINGLVYPVPHSGLPFLGVHLTRRINGEVEAGPNAILSLKREGYQRGAFSWKDTWDTLSYAGFWKMVSGFKKIGFSEWKKTMSKTVFTKAVQKMMPSVTEDDLTPAMSGVRAQAIRKDGSLVDDFLLLRSPGMIHVCNAPSPAATSCLSIGQTIAQEVEKAINSRTAL